MLKFDRKEFRAGVQTCYEKLTIDGQDYLKKHVFFVRDKGKTFTFENEDYMLAKYPVLFTKVSE